MDLRGAVAQRPPRDDVRGQIDLAFEDANQLARGAGLVAARRLMVYM